MKFNFKQELGNLTYARSIESMAEMILKESVERLKIANIVLKKLHSLTFVPTKIKTGESEYNIAICYSTDGCQYHQLYISEFKLSYVRANDIIESIEAEMKYEKVKYEAIPSDYRSLKGIKIIP